MEQQEKRRLQSLGLQPVTDIQFVARELQHTRQLAAGTLPTWQASFTHSAVSCQVRLVPGTSDATVRTDYGLDADSRAIGTR
jgi:hypothetical protein